MCVVEADIDPLFTYQKAPEGDELNFSKFLENASLGGPEPDILAPVHKTPH